LLKVLAASAMGCSAVPVFPSAVWVTAKKTFERRTTEGSVGELPTQPISIRATVDQSRVAGNALTTAGFCFA